MVGRWQASKNARFRHQRALQDLPMREQTRAKTEGAGATLIWSGNQTTADSSCKQGHDGYLASHDRAMLCQTQQYSQWSRCSSLHTAMLVLFCRARGPGLQERATKDTRISHLTAPVTLLLLLYFSIPFFLTQKCSHNQEEDLAPSLCSDWDWSSGFKPEFEEVGAPPLNYSPLQRENMVITGSEATCWHIAAQGTCVHPTSGHHIPPCVSVGLAVILQLVLDAIERCSLTSLGLDQVSNGKLIMENDWLKVAGFIK